MKNWVNHFISFIKVSKNFEEVNFIEYVLRGNIFTAIKQANFMVKYNKLSPEEKELWYLNENRVMEM